MLAFIYYITSILFSKILLFRQAFVLVPFFYLGKFVYPVGTSFARAYGSAECQRSKIVEVPPIVLPMGICNTNIIYRKAPSNFPVITNLELPNFRKVKEISSPNVSRGIIGDPSKPFARIEAARMIVIRKRKMRKHKLKKLRKRMKFVFERIRMRREQRKEKIFQVFHCSYVMTEYFPLCIYSSLLSA